MSTAPSVELQELARSYGVQWEYIDMSGQINEASSASLMAILKVLGANLATEADAPAALRERRLQSWKRPVEPVVVFWDDDDAIVEIRVPEALLGQGIELLCDHESGEQIRLDVVEPRPADQGLVVIEGERFRATTVPLDLPKGYTWLKVSLGGVVRCRTLLIRAPRRAYQVPASVEGNRAWGIFCPLYALHRQSSWGAGDFSDLEALIDWTAGQGGKLVASLPMLASNFDGPEPIISPYSPTSRLAWNEFYLDLERIPELTQCPAARALIDSEETHRKVNALRLAKYVDYGEQMRRKRAVLEVLAEWFYDNRALGGDELSGSFYQDHPEVEAYARFQATGECHGRDWRNWTVAGSASSEESFDPKAYRYHLYVQWKADEQLRALASKTKAHGLSWYVDFPIGVDHNSFDVFLHREVFATGASVGCPPDPVFTKGQNWGFPPAHPDRQRESGYAYLIDSIRNHLRYANALRIDHVMGLHRLFWIPKGAEAKEGAFVSTPSEEIYAILSVESHRHQAWLVGEDLGTVPPEVDQAMKQHNVRGMYVVQYEIRADEKQPLRVVPEPTVASVNTHDMPPFAAFWSGHDLDDRKDLGLLDESRLIAERQVREDQRRALVRFLQKEKRLEAGKIDPQSVLQAIHEWLAASASSVLLLNLEDLWLETEPQNTPNTYVERPNWKRKLRRNFEDFSTDVDLKEILKRVDHLRSQTV